MSQRVDGDGSHDPGFPRVSGDEPDLAGGAGHEYQFSPRERG